MSGTFLGYVVLVAATAVLPTAGFEEVEIVAQDEAKPSAAAGPCEPAAEPIEWTHHVLYENGWVLRPLDAEKTPYELRIGWHDQFRYTGFARDDATSRGIDGTLRDIDRRSDFDINRGRLVFEGFALSPKLHYYANVDYNTVTTRPIQLLSTYVRYDFSPQLRLGYGLVKLPGTWEWLESSRWTQGAERSMASTYFRPSFTTGLWADGRLGEHWSYRVMVADGFNTSAVRAADLDTNLAYSAMVWWEPLDRFGVGFSDLEYHEEAAIRLGHAVTFNRNDGNADGEPTAEQASIRLSDGTRLVADGALAPGVTVREFELYLYAIHAGWKYRGLSVNGEAFFRWLESISGNGPLPIRSVQDRGFFAQAGAFVIPERVETFARGSYVNGPFGSGSEVGGGANWYVQGTRNWRLTLDVAHVQDSPAAQARTGFEAGATGWLFRVQAWTIF